ncbi:glycosyltransferase family 4 protein [Candidatus Falkowbacteria bacterium]|jgi:glycosyltransferase involved in cell wall biosynthesis|nr:glycosyltransferase family 4 protein [Candidatus Falkowbacteria bacterium]
MIIGIDASRANRKLKTGTEWYSFFLIKNLAIIDKTNKYWLYLNAPPSPELVAAVKDNPNFVFKYLKWPFNAFWTLGRLSLEMIFCRPDVLFVPAHTLPLFSPRKSINTIHDVAFIREQNLYFSEKVKTKSALARHLINFLVKLFTLGKYSSESVDYLYWSTAFALKHAKKIITVSEFTKNEILNLYPETKLDKITVVHNGYNQELFHPINDEQKITEILNKYGITKPFFLYVGRLEKKKNTPALIEALSIVRENNPEIKEKLVLIGNASFGFDEVKYTITGFNLNQEVCIPGWVEEKDLPYIYNAASAFIFPSKHEGFGIPVLESLACGLPTVVSNLDVLREIAGDSVLYFDQEDKQSIAAAMTKVVKDEKLRAELREKGLQRVQNFSWHKCAAETLQVIEKL